MYKNYYFLSRLNLFNKNSLDFAMISRPLSPIHSIPNFRNGLFRNRRFDAKYNFCTPIIFMLLTLSKSSCTYVVTSSYRVYSGNHLSSCSSAFLSISWVMYFCIRCTATASDTTSSIHPMIGSRLLPKITSRYRVSCPVLSNGRCLFQRHLLLIHMAKNLSLTR